MKQNNNLKKIRLSQQKKGPCPPLKNQKGVAVVEMLFMLWIFIILYGLTFGFWTAIHSGILNSIAARHYAFSVLNNRTHFEYHRDNTSDGNKSYFKKGDVGFRLFAVVKYQEGEPDFIKVKKDLNLFNKDQLKIKQSSGNEKKASPIHLKQAYGICFNAECSRL